jgi:hypothetical protein
MLIIVSATALQQKTELEGTVDAKQQELDDLQVNWSCVWFYLKTEKTRQALAAGRQADRCPKETRR